MANWIYTCISCVKNPYSIQQVEVISDVLLIGNEEEIYRYYTLMILPLIRIEFLELNLQCRWNDYFVILKNESHTYNVLVRYVKLYFISNTGA